jgi:hypothetical protein
MGYVPGAEGYFYWFGRHFHNVLKRAEEQGQGSNPIHTNAGDTKVSKITSSSKENLVLSREARKSRLSL